MFLGILRKKKKKNIQKTNLKAILNEILKSLIFFFPMCQELWKVWDFTILEANKLALHNFMDAD
jgi:hypothetical protein